MNYRTIKPARWMAPLPLAASVLLLCGAGFESTKFRPPPDTRDYLNRVRAASAQLPMTLGDWVGKDVEVPTSAVKLLRPNVILSRQYVNTSTHLAAGFLFVDCSDARDTVGHYPPICYRSQGYSPQAADVKEWALPHSKIHLTEYHFVRSAFDSGGTLTVDDFFVLPGQGSVSDRDPVIVAAGDLQRRFYGVAQVQLVFDGNGTDEQRQQAFSDLIGPMEHLFQTVETIRPQQGVVP